MGWKTENSKTHLSAWLHARHGTGVAVPQRASQHDVDSPAPFDPHKCAPFNGSYGALLLQVYVVSGGFDGRAGWIQSKLQIKPYTSTNLTFSAPSFGGRTGTTSTRRLPAPRV